MNGRAVKSVSLDLNTAPLKGINITANNGRKITLHDEN